MSPSSRESNLSQYREALLQLNSEFFLMLSERRALSLKVQETKSGTGRYSHFDPEREKVLFDKLKNEMKGLSIKELLAFSLIMEDQAMAMAPGSYPTWSSGIHLTEVSRELYGMLNPLLLKSSHPELFARLNLNAEFSFLKEF
ncbi:MAG: chorismate mutase [Bdellovibrionales bacterium]|nr:chorismate mutase [Bdellovibrionales bacterium]